MPTSKQPPELSLFSTVGSTKDPDQAWCFWEPQPGALTSTQALCNSAHRVSSPTEWTSQSLTPNLQCLKCGDGDEILIYLNLFLIPWRQYLEKKSVQQKSIRGFQVEDADQMLPCPSLHKTQDVGDDTYSPLRSQLPCITANTVL